MDASPILADALRAMNAHRLEAVMIGNAAAALHGAPVTTVDIDFMLGCCQDFGSGDFAALLPGFQIVPPLRR